MPRWLVAVTWTLSLAGLAVAAYLTYEHVTEATTFACPESSVVNCVKVTTSSYSTILGVPVAIAGLAFYAVAAVVCSPWAWRVTGRWLAIVRVVGAVVGVVFVLYLVWAELFGVGAICLWCTAVHVITVLLLFFVLLATFAPAPSGSSARVRAD